MGHTTPYSRFLLHIISREMMFQLAGRMRWADVSLRLFTNEVLVRAKAVKDPHSRTPTGG